MAPAGADMALETSPYFGDAFHVTFQNGVTAIVHCDVLPASLRSSTRCKAELRKYDTLDMKDIESGTGHVILHFLYSGRYRCLKSSSCSEVEATIYELKLAFKVHAASLSLNLEILQALAEDEILKLSHQLSFPLVLDAVENSEISFAKFPRYAEYLQSHLISLKTDSLDQTATSILSKLETPDTFSMILLKTLVVLGSMAASNEPDMDREHYKDESSDLQSLSEQALEITKANEEIATLRRKEKQALEMINVCNEITILHKKKGTKGGKLGKMGWQRLALLDKQIAAYNLEHNQELLEEEDHQSTNQPAHIDEEPAEVEGAILGWSRRDSPGKTS
ncbi:uncharacterized protein FTOL_02699 [Fusarium torulosum]|uniref:BTB domain-containing protein n=1 Tax=Fusarium torulosum TaxID=33205 RepID=A0AAE8M2L4_9HYPO|nr:uncharacterized protein FTOL_02699 [Fusarium torulosum]